MKGAAPRPRRRLGDPGDRHRHRARDLRVALARQHRADARRSPSRRPRTPFDYAHANSVNLDTDGDFLMSARNTWTGLQDRPRDGQDPVAPGRQAEHFRLPRGRALRLAARRPPALRRRDHRVRQLRLPARAQVLARAGAAARRARGGPRRCLARRRIRARLLAATQGNQQTLPNGNFLVGWGSQRQLTEYDAARQRRCSTRSCRSATSPTAPTACRGSGCRGRGRRSRRRTSRARAPTPT